MKTIKLKYDFESILKVLRKHKVITEIDWCFNSIYLPAAPCRRASYKDLFVLSLNIFEIFEMCKKFQFKTFNVLINSTEENHSIKYSSIKEEKSEKKDNFILIYTAWSCLSEAYRYRKIL